MNMLSSRLTPALDGRFRVTRHHALRGGLTLAAGGLLLAAAVTPASAVPGDTDADTTVANVVVSSAISLTGLPASFTLTGVPGAVVAAPVPYTVETNNLAGYAVTVEAAAPNLVAQTGGNTDVIPVGDLAVRETGGNAFTPVSDTTPVTVHTQAGRSVSGGDALSSDYQVTIPFVNADTYSVTLDYVATTL